MTAATATILATGAFCETAHWTCEGAEGPAFWGALSPDFTTCATGMEQSHIDLAGTVPADAETVELNWNSGAAWIVVNNGHTIQANTSDGGGDNALFDSIMSAAPNDVGELALASGDPAALAPADPSYFRYQGSLTTPPCSETVIWTVMQKPVALSGQAIAAFEAIFEKNARPLQPVNRRYILSEQAEGSVPERSCKGAAHRAAPFACAWLRARYHPRASATGRQT